MFTVFCQAHIDLPALTLSIRRSFFLSFLSTILFTDSADLVGGEVEVEESAEGPKVLDGSDYPVDQR